jgi:hypothetical protein
VAFSNFDAPNYQLGVGIFKSFVSIKLNICLGLNQVYDHSAIKMASYMLGICGTIQQIKVHIVI